MDVKHFLATVGGFALSFIPGGNLISRGLRAAGPVIGGAALQSAGAKDVANQQQQAVQKGLDAQKEMFGQASARLNAVPAQQAALYAPYTALGAGAAGSLAQGLGLTPQSMSVPRVGVNPPLSGNTGVGGMSTTAEQARTFPTLLNGSQSQSPPTLQALQPIAASAARSSGYATMEAPDGSQKQVPVNEIERWRSLGARLV